MAVSGAFWSTKADVILGKVTMTSPGLEQRSKVLARPVERDGSAEGRNVCVEAGVEVAIATATLRGVRHIWAFVDNQAIVAASLTDSLSTSPATFRKL